jgi:elongation factor P
MIGVGDLKKGLTIELDGEPYKIEEYNMHKMQQRAPVLKLKLRQLRTGRLIERSFQAYSVKLELADVENRVAQYLYNDDDLYYFMDTTSYDQFPISKETLGEVLNYLREQTEVELIFYQGEAITIDLPNSVELRVVDTPPGTRGNTAQGGTKPATLETGLTVQVPLFVNNQESIRVDTRTGEYLTRVG